MYIILSGIEALVEYLSAHVLTCLIPAFFIAGAISSFMAKESILRYLGPEAKKYISYPLSSISGSILAVCSCTVLPLFSGIYKRGAGIGPATAFLYSGPAINILAIVYSARLLGYEIGLARAAGAVAFSLIIGFLMALIYKKEEIKRIEQLRIKQSWSIEKNKDEKSPAKLLLYFALLLGILIFGAAKKWIVAGILLTGLFLILWQWFKKEEIKEWMSHTYFFARQILPWLIGGVFVAGILKVVIPQAVITQYVGGNSLRSNFIASLVGALMYFATLTEVPIVKAFMELGMGKGPALSLLLAGPALSLPNMLVLSPESFLELYLK